MHRSKYWWHTHTQNIGWRLFSRLYTEKERQYENFPALSLWVVAAAAVVVVYCWSPAAAEGEKCLFARSICLSISERNTHTHTRSALHFSMPEQSILRPLASSFLFFLYHIFSISLSLWADPQFDCRDTRRTIFQSETLNMVVRRICRGYLLIYRPSLKKSQSRRKKFFGGEGRGK